MDGHQEEMEKFSRTTTHHELAQMNTETGSSNPTSGQQQSHQAKKESKPLSSEEKRGVILLLILYTIQGLPLGFFGGAISLLLTEKGISMAQLAELSIVFYPFTFKFLFAPLQDVYFSRKFGKRKSYIIPLQYALAVLFFITSFMIDDLLEQKAIGTCVVLGFIANVISSQQDVAVDGWVLTIFEDDEHVNIGSTCNTIGQTLGYLFCNGLFIQINSLEFCNRFIFSEPRTSPLVSAQTFLQILTLIVFLVTFYVHLFVTEKEGSRNETNSNNSNNKSVVDTSLISNESSVENLKQKKSDELLLSLEEEPPRNIIQVLKKLVGFITNKNLRMLLCFLLTYNIGVSPVRSSFGAKLMKQGVKKEFISSIGSLMIPVGFVAAVVASKMIKANSEMKVWRTVFVVMIFESLVGFAVVKHFDSLEAQDSLGFTVIIVAYQLVSQIAGTFRFVALGGLYNRISDEDLGGSSLTALNSFSNLGGQFSDQLSLFLLSAFSYEIIVAVGLAYSLLYLVVASKIFVPLQNLPKSAWSLHSHQRIKKL